MAIPEGIECVTVNRKPHPLVGSVLLYAQEKCHLRSLEVEMVQAPTEANGMMAICTATATFAPPEAEVRVYTDVGDASPRSCASGMHPHILRLASTRAMGRALRWGCGITSAVFEEVDIGAETAEGQSAAAPPRPGPPRPTNGQKTGTGTGKFCQFDGCGVEVPPSELKESWESFRKILCKIHREQMRRKIASHPAV